MILSANHLTDAKTVFLTGLGKHYIGLVSQLTPSAGTTSVLSVENWH